jgi:inosine-uridine nucleoside N-ribohydrolase
MRNLIVTTFFLFTIFTANSQTKIIFDTDFGGDADDLGALAMLHNLHNAGECELLGIASWSTEQYVIPAMDAVNRFYGNPEIPMGIRSKESHFQDWNYNKPIADNLPHQLSNNDVPLALDLYRKILSEQKDQSVTIVAVGPLKNIMDLIQSEPDKYSDLNGKGLIEKKVKEFVIMGGHFPKGENEWNFNGNMPGVTQYVLENLTVPVIFSGFEIGAAIKTGAVFSELPKKHPLFIGWRHFSEHAPWMKEYFKGEILNNSTFDQTAVLYAVREGIGEYWEKMGNGYCVAKENGDNYWVEGDKYNHAYLVLKKNPEEMARLIESIMLNEY